MFAIILLNMEVIPTGIRLVTFPFLIWFIIFNIPFMLCFVRIYLMGQSAGAHIASCTLLKQAIKEAGEGESVSWSVSQIKAYFGLSGG